MPKKKKIKPLENHYQKVVGYHGSIITPQLLTFDKDQVRNNTNNNSNTFK